MWNHSPLKTVLILGFMAFAFALAMDVYMPALPDIRVALHTTHSLVQLTLSLFLILTGLGQLILGPLSDHYGRYRIMLLSSILFFIGSLMCVFSKDIYILVFSRAIQAIGCCGLSVVSFAIVRDVYSGKKSSMIYSYINAIIAVSPILGPLIGVLLASHFHWQSAFIFLSLLALATFLVVVFFVKESLPEDRRKKVSLAVFSRYLIVIKSLQFWAFSLTAVSGMSAFFILFSMTPYIIKKLDLPLSYISLMFGLAGISFMIGSIFSSFIVDRLGVFKTAVVGVCFVLFAGCLSLLLYLVHPLTLWGFFIPCFFATFGCALTAGTGASGSMEPFFEIAGVASALFGAMEFAISGVVGSIAMIFPPISSLPIALAMISVSALALVFLFLHKTRLKN